LNIQHRLKRTELQVPEIIRIAQGERFKLLNLFIQFKAGYLIQKESTTIEIWPGNGQTAFPVFRFGKR
jgi:hypothetical protein